MALTLRQRKPGGNFHCRGTVLSGANVEEVAEHSTGTDDPKFAEAYRAQLEDDIKRRLRAAAEMSALRKSFRPVQIEPHEADEQASFVYLIMAGKRAVKIGRARDVNARVRDLQIAHHEPLSILAALFGGSELERELHKRFESDRLRGEWFMPTARIIRFANQMAKKHPIRGPVAVAGEMMLERGG